MAPPATPTTNRVKAATKLEKDVDSLNEAIRVEIADKDKTIQTLTEKLASSDKVIAYVEEKLKVKEEHEIGQKECARLNEHGDKQAAEIVALKQENASVKEELNRYKVLVAGLMSNGSGIVKQESLKDEGTESMVDEQGKKRKVEAMDGLEDDGK